MNKPRKKGLFERVAHGYFYGNDEEAADPHAYSNSLSEAQNKALRKIKVQTLFYSALAGTFGVLLLYLPPHFFPGFFALWTFKCSMFGYEFDLPLFSLLYGVILA